MKKLITLITLIVLSGTICFSQTVITYETHALLNGIDNPMSYCGYLEPGNAGQNITWDFSTLQFEKSFTGFLKNAQLTENGSAFPKANTELAEFSSRFYFNVNENQIEQYGYSSVDGRSRIYYETPFIKMKYPFAYGDIFTGSFTGSYHYDNLLAGSINGSYSVEADAFGTLILPGNKEFESTLRIKTTKQYETVFSSTTQEVEIVTYRWYNQSHRYPLLVLTTYKTTVGENVSVNYQAAYHNTAVNDIAPLLTESIRLFPNPASSALTLELHSLTAGTLKFEIIDATGRSIRQFNREVVSSGYQSFDLSDEIKGLRPATYILVIQNGENNIVRNFAVKPH